MHTIESLEKSKIKATIVEINQIIRVFSEKRNHAFEARYHLPFGTLNEISLYSSSIELALTGKISDNAWKKNITQRLKSLWPDIDSESLVKEWSNFSGDVDQMVLTEILKLKKFGPIYIVSNSTHKIEKDLIELNLKHHFDKIICSYECGYSKPSFEIYKIPLIHLKLKAEEVLWIEKESTFLRTAKGLGFQTLKFNERESFMRDLKNLIEN